MKCELSALAPRITAYCIKSMENFRLVRFSGVRCEQGRHKAQNREDGASRNSSQDKPRVSL